jgi:hypothetical protein
MLAVVLPGESVAWSISQGHKLSRQQGMRDWGCIQSLCRIDIATTRCSVPLYADDAGRVMIAME